MDKDVITNDNLSHVSLRDSPPLCLKLVIYARMTKVLDEEKYLEIKTSDI
jgi:hypothetical protein